MAPSAHGRGLAARLFFLVIEQAVGGYRATRIQERQQAKRPESSCRKQAVLSEREACAGSNLAARAMAAEPSYFLSIAGLLLLPY